MRLGQNRGVARRTVPDTLLAHSLLRAAIVWGGADPNGSRWSSQLALMRVMPRVARLVAFVVFWALTMDEQGVGDGELSPEVYAASGPDSRATTYRRLHDYGELWPDVDLNDMGRRLLAAAAALNAKPSQDTIVRLPALVPAAA